VTLAVVYLTITTVLLLLAGFGEFAIYIIPLLSLFVMAQLAATPMSTGTSTQGIHLRTLIRGHRILRWNEVTQVKVGPGIVVVGTRQGKSLRLRDPTGSLAASLRTHYRGGQEPRA
jgi:hypothetical protein